MISIVIPSFNEEENIESCLMSLANQTVPRDSYEIIVVDGGSKDNTRQIAEQYADLVFIQESPRVGGARNDGIRRARGDIVATTDADTLLPSDWLETLDKIFADPDVVLAYGPVYPIEGGIKNSLSLFLANSFARIGYVTRTIYFTLGCNTAFVRDVVLKAGLYQTVDAGDDLEIARRMRHCGKIRFDNHLKVGFSMRRYQQFGTLKSIYEWLYIVAKGGVSEKHSYTKKEYK